MQTDTKSILSRMRQLEIHTCRLVNDSLVGEYHSVFKGRGMDFDEVREYVPGDEVRTIDWNVTARAGHPFVKKFTEERELTILLMVDISASGQFGSTSQSKRDLAAELASVLAFSAIRNSDKVGLLLYMEAPRADASQPRPVSDAEYAIYARLFERRQLPLEPQIESTDDTSPHWTRHLVSYAAGYGGERLNALLYLPKNVKPPFQTIVFMPGSYAFYNKHALDDAEAMDGLSITKLLVLGGRAALFPVWKGMYERSDSYESSQAYFREHVYQWVSELRQSVEFLYSRPDIDRERVGFFGESFGAEWGPLLLALEPRIKTGVLMSGGLVGPIQSRDVLSPEINPATFAPHVRVPVLMINGRDDVLFVYETAQVPLFNLLGSPANKKKHKTYPGSHSVFGSYDELARDTHDWLDEQFGPITAPGRK